MAALLVAMSIMAIMMSVALPAWHTMAQREKEAELIFRGEQYARAFSLFQRRYANATAPNLDLLVNEKFLRKKYKDPITNDDFQLVGVGTPLPGEGQQPQAPGGPNPAGRGRGLDLGSSGRQAGAGAGAGPNQPGGGTGRGIVGVVSKSTERSFRLYKGRDTYNQWVFMGLQQSTSAGGPGGLPPGAGGRGVDGRGGLGGGGGRDGRGGLGGGRDGRGAPIGPGLQPPGRGGRGN